MTSARAAANETKTIKENELKPREDNDSDQVSSHDKAIVGESVHV